MAGSDVDAGRKSLVKGEEASQDSAVKTAIDANVRAAAGSGAADDVSLGKGNAAEGGNNVADGHADAAREGLIIGKKAEQPRAVLAAEDRDVRSAAAVGAANDVGEAVAVHIAGRDVGAAREVAIVGVEIEELRPILAAVDN